MGCDLKRVYCLRHGETKWTMSGQHTSNTDISLTENGRIEARELGNRLRREEVKFDNVLCSPYLRTRETCELAGLLNDAQINEDLKEWNYGDYEGITTKEIQKIDPGWTVFSKPTPGGESFDEVLKRADRLVESLLKLSGTVAIVSSGHFTRVIASRWIEQDVRFGARLKLSTGSMGILGFEHGNPCIELWNSI